MLKKIPVLVLLFSCCGINKISSQDTTGEAYLRKANEFKKNRNTDSALIYYQHASIAFERSNKTEAFVDANNQAAILLTRLDQYEKARSYLEKALAAGSNSLDSNNLAIANTYISLGVISNAEGKYEQALSQHYKALAIRLAKLGNDHADVATSYGNLGNVHRNNKELSKSIELHSKAMVVREKLFGTSSPEIVESYVGLGRAYQETKDFTTALAYFEKALQNKTLQLGSAHKDLARFYKYASDASYLAGNKAKGDEYREKGEAL